MIAVERKELVDSVFLLGAASMIISISAEADPRLLIVKDTLEKVRDMLAKEPPK